MEENKDSKPLMERRKRRRQPCSGRDSVFIEIDHSYGTRKTSVYTVTDRDEKGLSFIVPSEDGYFLSGTPLRFSIIRQEKFKTKHMGIARYHHPVFSDSGEKLFKVGVELRSALRNPPRTKYVLRPRRLPVQSRSRYAIEFSVEGKTHHYDLVDFSKYSAAFSCSPDQFLSFKISSVLSNVRILMGKAQIFQGTATITQVYTDRQKRHRVVVEPREALIDTGYLQRMELAGAAYEGTTSLIHRHDSFQNIDTTFKAMVADLRFFLEDFQDYFKSPMFQVERRDPTDMLREIFPPFYEKTDSKVTRLDTYVRGMVLDAEEEYFYKQYYQNNLLPLFITAPYNHRVYFKPKGYPGDFKMMWMVHNCEFEGSTLFGKMFNKYSTSIPVAAAVRERTAHFKRRVLSEIGRNDHLRVLSVASGPALEFSLLLKEAAVTDHVSITLLDQEIEALRFSMDKLYGERFRTGSTAKINFIQQSLGNYLRSVARGRVGERYDLIYASGLFDYFDDKTSRFVIRKLLTLLDKGGKLIVSNLSLQGHDHKVCMEFGLEWKLVYRSGADMARLAEAAADSMDTELYEMGGGILKFLEIKN